MEPPAGVALQLEEKWSQQSGLNRRPLVYKTNALPLSYAGLLAEGEGFEPSEPLGFTSLAKKRFRPLSQPSKKMAPRVGLEPTTTPLTAVGSTIELPGILKWS